MRLIPEGSPSRRRKRSEVRPRRSPELHLHGIPAPHMQPNSSCPFGMVFADPPMPKQKVGQESCRPRFGGKRGPVIQVAFLQGATHPSGVAAIWIATGRRVLDSHGPVCWEIVRDHVDVLDRRIHPRLDSLVCAATASIFPTW